MRYLKIGISLGDLGTRFYTSRRSLLSDAIAPRTPRLRFAARRVHLRVAVPPYVRSSALLSAYRVHSSLMIVAILAHSFSCCLHSRRMPWGRFSDAVSQRSGTIATVASSNRKPAVQLARRSSPRLKLPSCRSVENRRESFRAIRTTQRRNAAGPRREATAAKA